MTAKSAPQLPVSPLNRARGTPLHAHGTLLILAFALLMAAATWLLERADAHGVASAADAQLEPLPVPQASATTPEAAPPTAASPVETAAAPAAAMSAAAAPAASAPAAEAKAPENRRYRTLSAFLAKRYRVSQAVMHDLVTIAHAAGHQIGVDPLLIIAVMAVESRFNPIAESAFGAKGLMQIIPRYHTEKFQEHGGVKAAFDPEANILVGSRIIKEYLARTGNLNSALQLYGGVSSSDNDIYFDKVMTEKQRLLQVLQKSS